MGFSHKNRFLKKYDLPYYVRLNVRQVSELSGISIEILQVVYDKDYVVNKRDALAMLCVYSYCNGGKVYKQMEKEKLVKNTNE